MVHLKDKNSIPLTRGLYVMPSLETAVSATGFKLPSKDDMLFMYVKEVVSIAIFFWFGLKRVKNKNSNITVI